MRRALGSFIKTGPTGPVPVIGSQGETTPFIGGTIGRLYFNTLDTATAATSMTKVNTVWYSGPAVGASMTVVILTASYASLNLTIKSKTQLTVTYPGDGVASTLTVPSTSLAVGDVIGFYIEGYPTPCVSSARNGVRRPAANYTTASTLPNVGDVLATTSNLAGADMCVSGYA